MLGSGNAVRPLWSSCIQVIDAFYDPPRYLTPRDALAPFAAATTSADAASKGDTAVEVIETTSPGDATPEATAAPPSASPTGSDIDNKQTTLNEPAPNKSADSPPVGSIPTSPDSPASKTGQNDPKPETPSDQSDPADPQIRLPRVPLQLRKS